MNIYVDDTTFFEDRDSGQEYVGIGCLLVDNDNTKDIVEKAINNLKADPDIKKEKFKKQDSNTIANGYFHACDDSQNAHSHFCTAIREELVANFQYTYSKNDPESRDKAWKQCLYYLAVITTQAKNEVDIFIEQRANVSQESIKEVFDYVYKGLDWGCYDLCAIPKFYPKVNLQIVSKENAGVQIVDFITWARNRSHFSVPDTKWEKRLGFSATSAAGRLGEDIYQGDIIFRGGVRENHMDVYPKEAFPIGDFGGNDHICKSYETVIKEVLDFLFNNVDKQQQLNHIFESFIPLRNEIIKLDGIVHSGIIDGISSCYLRLFDMLPLYGGLPKTKYQEYSELIKTKKLCGLTLRKDLIHGVRTNHYLSSVFRNTIKISK